MTDDIPLVKEAVEATAAAFAGKAGTAATYAGAVGAVLGFIASAQFVAVMGLALGVGGFLVNAYFKSKEDRRREEEHAALMARYKSGLGPIDHG